MPNQLDKNQLRQQLKQVRDSLSASERSIAAQDVGRRLAALNWDRHAAPIGVYHAMPNELDLAPFIAHCRARGIPLSLPRIDPLEKGKMDFYAWQQGDPLRRNQLGIEEPAPSEPVAIFAHRAILMPLLGFDAKGNRLGMGGGYYDRLLAHTANQTHRPLLIGVAFDCQQVEELPVEPWDIGLDGVVTEKALLSCSPGLSAIS